MAGKKKGGTRPGAGRKSKAEEQGLQYVLKKAVSDAERIQIFTQLKTEALEGSIDAKKLLLAYIYGTPTAHHNVTSDVVYRIVDDSSD